MKTPTLKELECLLLWPKDSAGYNLEKELIIDLLKLCEAHGYGRVPQMAAWIEDIWRDEEHAKKKYKAIQDEHFEFMGWIGSVSKRDDNCWIFQPYFEFKTKEEAMAFANKLLDVVQNSSRTR